MEKQRYSRRKTRTVYVGQVAVGGNNPIRIQSMCTSDTKDTEAVINEVKELVDAGCEIVRVTVPTKTDCANLANIRAEMARQGIKVPLVADIHFTPSIAMDVVDFVEKVRINPGNFVDKKLFKSRDYTNEEYQEELDRIEEKFTPLVLKCKDRGVAMRIGTNHGSLSDRIMNRYGDTPEGMVESALEFLRIVEKNNYHDIILSMKASNPQVMITAYRLLAQRLEAEDMDYPFHLGVTEAGDGEDGRIKSALGIGTLLEEGIGDTIRVSLTEDAVHEVPVAYMLATPYNAKISKKNFTKESSEWTFKNKAFPLSYERRESAQVQIGSLTSGQKEQISVWTNITNDRFEEFLKAQSVDFRFEGVEIWDRDYSEEFLHQAKAQGFAVSLFSSSSSFLDELTDVNKWAFAVTHETSSQKIERLIQKARSANIHLEICLSESRLEDQVRQFVQTFRQAEWTNYSFSVLSKTPLQSYRELKNHLDAVQCDAPLHLRHKYNQTPALIEVPIQLGGLFVDGIGDSIQIDTDLSYSERLSLSYGTLQASRARISKTEFIACPSCGRTLFDLQEVTARIKAKTSHLKGVKLAIMGCIVNGPGEMADADFGYVGTGTGKISLYVGKECVERNIPETNALDALIELIKKHDRWVEPAQDNAA